MLKSEKASPTGWYLYSERVCNVQMQNRKQEDLWVKAEFQLDNTFMSSLRFILKLTAGLFTEHEPEAVVAYKVYVSVRSS